jgi:hypothetical protein
MANINLYKTTTMKCVMDLLVPVHTFLKDTFFSMQPETFVTEKVLLDYRKGKRKMAPFVAPRVGGITLDRQGFKTFEYAAPRLAPQRALTIDDLSSRAYGENLISNRTPADREAELLAKDLQELDEAIARREEWMAAQLLFTGKVIAKGYADSSSKNIIEDELDYGLTNKTVLAGTDKWDQADADIYGQLEDQRLDVIEKSGRAPTVLVMGTSALKAFRSNAKIKELLDVRNMYFGSYNPTIKSDAVTYIGRLNELGLDIYTYNDWYEDDDGNTNPFVPTNQVLMALPGDGKFMYGAVTQLENGNFYTYEGTRVPKHWADEINEIKMIKVSSRPLPCPCNIDGWAVLEVI